MSGQKIYRALGLSVLMALLMTGCDLNGGGALLEVVYPSGYTRTATTWDDLTPVEGTSYQLRAEQAKDYDKTHAYDLQIVDEAGSLLYAFPGAGQTAMRGEAAESEAVWICSEWWDAAHFNGYLSGHLTRSMVLLVDMRDGAVLFQGETGKDELYLTSEGTLCYFYRMDRDGRENASICCRDIRDWEEARTVYTFDYTEKPDIATYNDSKLKARFILGDDQIRVSWESTDRVLNDDGKYEAVFSEKASYDISLDAPIDC